MEQNLEDEIERIREAMTDVAAREGLTADETIELSRRLDALINEYDALEESDLT